MMGSGSIFTKVLCRPGGFVITDRALGFCGFEKGARLADIGCGIGATVRYVAERHGLDIRGIDEDEQVLAAANCQKGLLQIGQAEHLPFADEEMDGLLFECSFSKMEAPALVVAECYRVLRHDGYLIVSDLYARGEEANLLGILGRLDTTETLINRLKAGGFALRLFEDFSEFLREIWGQMVFQYGADMLFANIGADSSTLRRIKCGYCLVIAQKCGGG